MHGKFADTAFARLYLWTSAAKYTMGIFFVMFVSLYLFLGFISEGAAVTLDFFTAIQMVCACLLIGFARQGIVPNDRLTKPRCVLWVGVSTLVTLVFSLLFGWFEKFPPWCLIMFLAMTVVGMAAALLGHFIELYRETRLLNHQLEKFQQRPGRED
ncbi:MAG: hypothetical protein LBH86_08335 [Oscillospiraceae bacterium]|jgi:hypothetical protein|nr:hypothetical protein [Oscillospiraceae bacterium]